MHSKLIRAFVLSAGVILILTGLAKLISATGDAKILDIPDPLLVISFRRLFAVLGALEVIVGLGCVLGKRRDTQIVLIAWLSLNFAVYRLAMYWGHIQRPCSCLGNITEALHISPDTADAVMRMVLLYLLAGCSFSWAALWQEKRRLASTSRPA